MHSKFCSIFANLQMGTTIYSCRNKMAKSDLRRCVCVCVCVCVCALSTDQIPEGIRELESLLDKRDLVVCAPLLLVHAHKRCKLVGQYSTIRCLLA